MNTVNRIHISASYERLFAMASDIAQWPKILPHYRYVKVSERGPQGLVAEMAARHWGFPLWWKTLQQPIKEQKKILFRHIGGVTTGMEVQWTFESVGDPGRGQTWLVQIHHQFKPRWGVFRALVADHIIGKLFVTPVANKTLRRMKYLLENPS